MKLEEAIQQRKFKDEWHRLQVNILYTASWIHQRNNKVLKPFKISGPQFNILRILRGMYPDPASVKLLTERMIDKDSNASRLVDKLVLKGLVERHSCQYDRRKVDVIITEQGLALLEKASLAIETQGKHLEHTINESDARMLNAFLDKIRQ